MSLLPRITVLALGALLLTGCGFQLRGSYAMPAFLTDVTVQVPRNSEELARELTLAFERVGIATNGDDLVLEVTRELRNRQTATVDSRAKAAEYTLVYAVDWRLVGADGRALSPLQPLILRRSYQYDATNVVGKNTEEENLVQELRRDAARQIVRQLGALKASSNNSAQLPDAPGASAP